MATKSSLTASNIVSAFKKAGFATKDDVGQIIANEIKRQDLPTKKDVKDIFHNALTQFHAGVTQPEIKELRDEIQTEFKEVHKQLDNLEANVSFIKDDLKGITSDISITPSRQEFEDLKTRVRKVEIAPENI